MNNEQDVDYIECSASALIYANSDAHFDNSSMLAQFERLFNLLDFKKCSKNNKIEITVDNARKRPVPAYNLLDFGKGISTRCLVNYLEWIGNTSATQALSCYFQHGSNKEKSNGCFEIAK